MNLLFIDLETTGLYPKFHHILEVAAVFVDGETLQEGAAFHQVVWQPQQCIGSMDDWARATHMQSGLVDEVVESNRTLKQVDEALSFFVRRHTKDNVKPTLAGNSVHFDLGFINEHMPLTASLLSYRIVDVSGMHRTFRMLGVPVVTAGSGPVAHRALPDVRQSIDQLHLIRAAVVKETP